MLRTIERIIIIVFALWFFAGCSEQIEFATFEKIDAHLHIRYLGPEFLNQAKADNFKVISILVDHRDIQWQKDFIIQQRHHYADQLRYVTTFTMQGWDEPDWQKKTIEHLKREFTDGAIAVKVWKNIGMVFRDKDSSFVMIDNPGFDPILDLIESQGKTLTGHIGEPRDCWLPIEKMVASSNRNYYRTHPEYHMYLHPDCPSYQQQIDSYAHMLEKHPNLRYVGCHLGSIEWSVDELGKMLDRFPNLAVDLAARIDDLQNLDRDKVRGFFISYQDRILYGTDLSISEQSDPAKFAARMHKKWLSDWTYFATDSVMTIDGIDKPVQGLGLPANVLKKIYQNNAKKYYRGI